LFPLEILYSVYDIPVFVKDIPCSLIYLVYIRLINTLFRIGYTFFRENVFKGTWERFSVLGLCKIYLVPSKTYMSTLSFYSVESRTTPGDKF